jgi:TPR repeat protein
MALQGGAPYKDMLANFFPKLRRSDYELHYTVTPFTIEEGKKKLETAPSQLSLNEMFLIAQTYPAGSHEFRRIFDIAAYTYPGSEIANFNAAANALDARDVNTAKKYMDMLETRDATWQNNMGILVALQGNHDEAEEYFKKAVEEGNQEAVKNLAEIGKVKKQIAKN